MPVYLRVTSNLSYLTNPDPHTHWDPNTHRVSTYHPLNLVEHYCNYLHAHTVITYTPTPPPPPPPQLRGADLSQNVGGTQSTHKFICKSMIMAKFVMRLLIPSCNKSHASYNHTSNLSKFYSTCRCKKNMLSFDESSFMHRNYLERLGGHCHIASPPP